MATRNPPRDDKHDAKTNPNQKPKAKPKADAKAPRGLVALPANRDKLTAHDKQLRAVQLRRNGRTYDDIARIMGYSNRSAAHKVVSKALEVAIREPAEEVRQLELMRLDRLMVGLWPLARKGDQRAVDVCLRIMDRRAALLGLYKVRGEVELTVRDVVAEAEFRALNFISDVPPEGHPSRDEPQWQSLLKRIEDQAKAQESE